GKSCDESKVAPNEWQNCISPAAEAAESVHLRCIAERDGDSSCRFPENHQTESGNEPVTEPQSIGGGVATAFPSGDPERRCDPEQLRHHDQRYHGKNS